jgi:hypothetical protein
LSCAIFRQWLVTYFFSLVRAGLSGQIELVIALGSVEVIDWSTGDDLSVAVDVESPDGRTRELRRYDKNGQSLGSTVVAKDEYRAAILRPGGKLSITRYGALVRDNNGRRVTLATVPLKHLNMFDTTCLTLPQSRVAIVDQVDATVTVVDLKSALVGTATLNGPEIAAARRNSPPTSSGTQSLSILAATTDSAGTIYCMLTGFRADEGAPLIVLDSQAGKVESSFRLRVARYASGPMVPSAIAVTQGLLIVVDQSGHVAEYPIPSHQ